MWDVCFFLCSVRILLSSFYLLLYPLHSWWRTHTLKSELFPKTVATRLTCQCGKNHMCILCHHFIKYLCKLKFQNILVTRTGFAPVLSVSVSWWFLITFWAIGKLFMWGCHSLRTVVFHSTPPPCFTKQGKTRTQKHKIKRFAYEIVAVWFFNLWYSKWR